MLVQLNYMLQIQGREIGLIPIWIFEDRTFEARTKTDTSSTMSSISMNAVEGILGKIKM